MGVVCKTEPPKSPLSTRESIAAARAGDERALEDLIRCYQDRVAGYVVAHVGNSSADIDDLCQIIFLKMALSLPALRSADAFELWLFKIARNVCRDHLRRLAFRQLFVPLSHEHEAIATVHLPGEPVGPGALDVALHKLSDAQRKLIDLLRQREYSYEELARLTKSSVRAVAGRLFRARARLRKIARCNGAAC